MQSAYNYYQVSMLDPASAADMVSTDRHTTFIYVTLAPGDADLGAYLSTAEGLSRDGFTVTTIGQASIGEELSSAATSDLRSAETVGLPITMLVLVIVFGAFVAAGISLILALVTIGVTIGGVIAIGTLVPQSFFIVNIVMMIGLAVGIDYALLIIERYREERRQGLGKHEAIVATGRTASRAVLFSGGTVMLALVGLFIVPITTFRSLGLGAVLVVGYRGAGDALAGAGSHQPAGRPAGLAGAAPQTQAEDSASGSTAGSTCTGDSGGGSPSR